MPSSRCAEDQAPWVAAVVTFFVLTGAVVLAVLAVIYHSHISHFLCPGDTLPLHLKEVCTSPRVEQEKPNKKLEQKV